MTTPIKLPTSDDRVFISRPYVGLIAMQVCVLPEATDEEILHKCNSENPSGTSAGWSLVINSAEQAKEHGIDSSSAPGPCNDCEGRIHKIVLC
jgi:hypothetical protein